MTRIPNAAVLLEPFAPRERPDPELCVWKDGACWSDSRLDSASFAAQAEGGEMLSRLGIDRCEFERVRLSGARWGRLDATDIVMSRCDLSNAIWPGASVFRARFHECGATGLRANQSLWQHVAWSESSLNLSQFRFARFKSVRFERCLLRGADFSSSDLRGVVFSQCDLSGAHFQSAKLDKADIRGCKIDGMKIDAQALRGLIIDPAQAIHFVGLLGARIAPAGEELGA